MPEMKLAITLRSVTLEVLQGDITDDRTDAIVNTTDSRSASAVNSQKPFLNAEAIRFNASVRNVLAHS